jgi:hypothetical protein
MRTTITLDPDVDQLIRKIIRERDLSFKDAVNDAIRAGLKKEPVRRKPFKQKTFAMGSARYFQWEKAIQKAEELEDNDRIGKMALRK